MEGRVPFQSIPIELASPFASGLPPTIGGKVLDIDDDVVEDKDEANNGTFSRLVWSEPVVQSPGN